MIFLDVEASGLHATSYPIEVAWVAHDLSGAWSTLIRPAPAWGEADWSHESERVHGISRHVAVMGGMDAARVAARLNVDLAGAEVLTDSPNADGRWLNVLFFAADQQCAFNVDSRDGLDVDALITTACQHAKVAPSEHELFAAALNREAGIVVHRALDDAIAHALSLGAVSMLELANAKGDAAADFRRTLVKRARLLLQQHGREASIKNRDKP